MITCAVLMSPSSPIRISHSVFTSAPAPSTSVSATASWLDPRRSVNGFWMSHSRVPFYSFLGVVLFRPDPRSEGAKSHALASFGISIILSSFLEDLVNFCSISEYFHVGISRRNLKSQSSR
jgi:hypothetical protein